MSDVEGRASGMSEDAAVLVAGAGGFLGGHLVGALVRAGHRKVRAVDRKPLERWACVYDGVDNRVADLTGPGACEAACDGIRRVFQLAATDGGAGFAATRDTERLLSARVDLHLLLAARDAGVERFMLASSAGDHPAKRYAEALCRRFGEDTGMQTRIARYASVYGPLAPWMGGAERAPAALCRKALEAKLSGELHIEIWGDGRQTRAPIFVDDAIEATLRVAASDVALPVAIAGREDVRVDEIVSAVEAIAGLSLERRYVPDAPTGPSALPCDGVPMLEALGFEAAVSLREGLEKTWKWIHDEYLRRWGGHLGPRERRPAAVVPAAARG